MSRFTARKIARGWRDSKQTEAKLPHVPVKVTSGRLVLVRDHEGSQNMKEASELRARLTGNTWTVKTVQSELIFYLLKLTVDRGWPLIHTQTPPFLPAARV